MLYATPIIIIIIIGWEYIYARNWSGSNDLKNTVCNYMLYASPIMIIIGWEYVYARNRSG